MKPIFCFFVLGMIVLASGRAEDRPALRTARAVRDLPVAEAQKGLPVRLRGWVSFTDESFLTTFFDDGTAGVYVAWSYAPGQSAPLRAGTRVEVVGITTSGHFANNVCGPDGGDAQITVLGAGEMPEPAAISGTELAEPGQDCRWVAVDAQIREVFVADEAVVMECFAEPCVFHVVLAGRVNRLPGPMPLVDSWVRLRGVVATTFNRERQMTRRLLRVSSLADIETLPGSLPPDTAPRTVNADDLLREDGPGPATLVRLRGVVTLVVPGRGFFLRTPRGALWVQSAPAEAAAAGTEMEVDGWPRPGLARPFLRAQQARILGPGAIPQPRQLTAQAACDELYDAELISVEAELLEVVPEAEGLTLELRAGGRVFRAHLAGRGVTPGAAQLRQGSRLRVTGIAQVSSSREFQPVQDFDKLRLLLRTVDDVEVLAWPSRWTARNVSLGAGAVLLSLLSGYALRRGRRLRERAAQRREFEAVLAERSRLAREIHDSLAQGFTSISLQLECVRNEVGTDNAGALGHLEIARGLVRESLQEARRSVWNLRPLALGEADLAGALRRIAGELTGGTLIVCTHESEGPPRPLEPDQRNALLRIGQEALTNAVRHAQPRHLAVRLSYTPEWITLWVRDDGCGFDVAQVAQRARQGFGLLGMYERVAALSGSLAIDSRVGEGTEVSATLPA